MGPSRPERLKDWSPFLATIVLLLAVTLDAVLDWGLLFYAPRGRSSRRGIRASRRSGP